MKFKNKAPVSTTITVDPVGSVLLTRSARAQHLNIRISPYRGVRVSVPRSMSFEQAEKIVRARVGWIAKHLKRIQALEKKAIIYDGSQTVATRHHRLEVKAAPAKKVTIQIGNGVVAVRYPQKFRLTDRPIQEAIRTALTEAYRIEAKNYLPKKLEYLANKHGFKYNRVFIKNHKSRWGSCSAKNNINLNLNLMRLPDELVDYVLLHELVHTKIKNHGPEFWRLLGKVCRNAKQLNKQLNKHALHSTSVD
ncbi:MAG: M48 family metallopeptidase [bacterium]